MSQRTSDCSRLLLLSALIVWIAGSASAAGGTRAGIAGPGDVAIEIGSTYSFGRTPVGAAVTRSFQLINKDTARPMRIYGFWIGGDRPGHPEWAIVGKPREDAWIPPGETAQLKIEFLALQPGAHKANISWYVEMKPASEEDKDNFFVFNVTGEALEGGS